jgi:succinyl-diaminopimelate desuccinylase
MESLEMLKQLVGIPSDKNAMPRGGYFEFGVACWLRDYIKNNFPGLVVEEQLVEKGRINLFIHDAVPASLLFLCHIDTVEEGKGWTTSPRGEIKGRRFYGRGSLDMKCGAVAVLTALRHAVELEKTGLAVLFYADEEYESKGIKKFIAEYGQKIKPKLIVCLEPTEGQLRRGCRGIVELRYVLNGRTGHAAQPKSGISAFDGLNRAINALSQFVQTISDPYLGHPTINIARVRCGAIQEKRPDGFIVFSAAGNIIPDYCEVLLEVRTVPGLDEEKIKQTFQSGLKTTGVVIDSVETRSNLGSFVSPRENLKLIEEIFYEVIGGEMYQDIERAGYTDAQMLTELWQTPTIIWGADGDNHHGADEYVDLPSFEKLETGLKKLVERWE